DPRRKRGKARPKTEAPYLCPHLGCHKPIGTLKPHKALPLNRLPERSRQQTRMNKCSNVPRAGARGFEPGCRKNVPAWNGNGRRIGQEDRCPRVPGFCKHCDRKISREWALAMK